MYKKIIIYISIVLKQTNYTDFPLKRVMPELEKTRRRAGVKSKSFIKHKLCHYKRKIQVVYLFFFFFIYSGLSMPKCPILILGPQGRSVF